jgi:hypothetical protein
MGLGKTFTSVPAAMRGKLPTDKVVMGLPLSIVWGNTHEHWANLSQNDFLRIFGDKLVSYPLRRHHSVHSHLSEIQSTPPQDQSALTSAFEPILVVTMLRVAETFKSVIEKMIY